MWVKKNRILSMAWRGLVASGPHAELRAQALSQLFGFLAAVHNADRNVARLSNWASTLASVFVEAGSRGLLGEDVVFMALVRAMSTHYSDPTDLARLDEPMKAGILSVLDNPLCALADENATTVRDLRDLLTNA
jgi:hypothetical protein